MLKVRIIPTLLLKDGRLIKTKQFDTYRDVGNPQTVAKIYDAQFADELIFLDITATTEKRNQLFDTIRGVAEECFMPLTVGGGVSSVEDARALLECGADKVAVNSAAVERPSLLTEIANKFGISTVVASIDYKKNSVGDYEVFTCRGKKATDLHPVDWAKEVERLGAGEILLTNIENEGMMCGYDIDTIREVSDSVSIPVIASGGVGTVQDFVDGHVKGHASAVAGASIFHFTDQGMFKAHSAMKEAGLNVRWYSI